MKYLLKIISNALFPRACAGCSAADEDFCLSCRISAKPPGDFAFRAEWLTSVWSYQDQRVRSAVRALKYRGKKPIAKIFAEALYEKLLEELSEKEMFAGEMEVKEEFLLIPIPLSNSRLQKRGFNQSALIAKYLACLAPEIFENRNDVLLRIKNTEHQTLLKNRDERLKNLEGSFIIKNPDAVRGKIIILIDDVTTTGATLMEARRVLLSAGARRVYGATIAH